MDVTNLILYLKNKTTSDSIDQQMVSKAIKLLELGAVNTSSLFATMPSPVNRSGELWYVLYDGLYWSTGDYWIPLVQTTVNSAWAWGCNLCGMLGNNTTVSTSSPVSVVGGFSDWSQVRAGGASAGLRSNGTIWSWGANNSGSLGDNTSTIRSSPVSVVGGFSDWCHLGDYAPIASRSNGTAWAWGLNSGGQLGDNTIVAKSSPVSVVGGFTDWCRVDRASQHSLAVRTGGSAWAWGCNGYGRLGDNTTTNRSSPVSVVGGFSDWCQLSGAQSHSVGVRTNGTAWAWGYNASGQLGDTTFTNRSSPVSVVGAFTNWCQVSTGAFTSFGLRANGSIWAWGRNTNGMIGDNTTTSKNSPVSVVGGFTDWCQVFCSGAVRTNGSLWRWGSNAQGQLGDGTTTAKSSPVSVIGGFLDWCCSNSRNDQVLAIRSTTL